VQGQHEPIISESLFYEVQDVLEGRKRKIRTGAKIITHDALAIRGFLICPQCGRMLTGRASKGRHNHYYYYHCVSSCGCRFKAEHANGLFVQELKKYVPFPGMNDIYVVAIGEAYNNQIKHLKSDRTQILFQLDNLNTRLKNAREMVADQKLDPDDFREFKAECTTKINELEAKLTGLFQKENNIDG
jgi:site-specific DNA recombinase